MRPELVDEHEMWILKACYDVHAYQPGSRMTTNKCGAHLGYNANHKSEMGADSTTTRPPSRQIWGVYEALPAQPAISTIFFWAHGTESAGRVISWDILGRDHGFFTGRRLSATTTARNREVLYWRLSFTASPMVRNAESQKWSRMMA